MILLVDNEDSFVHNLARYFVCLGHDSITVRHDQLTVAAVQQLEPAAIVLSPGPGTPTEESLPIQLVRQFQFSTPILGICLGHQQICLALGGRIVRAAVPVHGRTSLIQHDGEHEFSGIETPFPATRYHSLIVDESSLPGNLRISARTVEGTIMGVRSIGGSVVGWQFHPESILTRQGLNLIRSFLNSNHLVVSSREMSSEMSSDLEWNQTKTTRSSAVQSAE